MDVGRIGLLISVFALASLRAAAPQASAQPPAQAPAVTPDSAESIPTIHVTTRLVILDVVVSDGLGHPAAGLKPSDFILTEDGVPQTIDSFTEHDVVPPAESAIENDALPPNTFTVQPPVTGNGAMTVIVLDAGWRWSPFVRDQLKEYLQTAALATPTAIFRVDWQGMHLVQPFTTDRNVLLEAATSQRILPPLGFVVRYAHAVGSPTQHLARYLAGIPGRINLIWIGGTPGEDLDKDLPDESNFAPDVSSMIGDLNRTADVRRLSRVVLYTIGVGASCMTLSTRDLSDLVNSAGGRGFRCTDPKPAIEQITATGSHYYTISYHPTNADWNGAYRKIHLDVSGYAQPPFTLRWYQLITGWAGDVEPTVMYRQGYFARSTPPRNTNPDFGTAALTSTIPNVSNTIGSRATLVPQRKLISVSPKGAYSGQLQAALAFGSFTPIQVHFTIVVTPAPEKEKTKPRDDLPTGNFLTPPFRDGPYRNYRIHYWIDPQDLHFVRTASGLYHDDLKTIAVVYRDDGLAANSYATTTRFDVNAADLEAIQASGFTLDQTLAIPTTDKFFLRAAVSEESTSRIGALEISTEWIKVPPPNGQLALKPAP